MFGKLLLLGWLFALALIDTKRKQLPLILLGLCAGCGLAVRCVSGDFSGVGLLLGLLPGAVLVAAALLSKEQIGLGDGLLFLCAGLYTGLWQSLLLLFFASVICAVCSAILLAMGRCKKTHRLPFIPFVLAADVLLLAI